jgi:hypothetical protein
MSKRDGPELDHRITFVEVLNDLLFVTLATLPTKPADNRVWEALGRLDALRRQLQRDLGQEPTLIEDVHGRVSYDK